MHPMFKELFIETDPEDLSVEKDRRRRVRRSRAGPVGQAHQTRRPSSAASAAAVTHSQPAGLRHFLHVA